MSTVGFFNERKDQSKIKSIIVTKYFWAWAKVMLSTIERYKHSDRIVYLDLFAGPGRYDDGSQSTPLMILSEAVKDAQLCQRLVTIFNDANCNHTQCLQNALSRIEGIEKLDHKPLVLNDEVGDQMVKMFQKTKLAPTFFFVDPWGYKGLSLKLVNSVIKDWGCDCVFFFNYNRINMGVTNNLIKPHMTALFGKKRLKKLRDKVAGATPTDREAIIINDLALALNRDGDRFVLPFCFKDKKGKRTSHHLIFVTKGFKGYEIMKEIMAKESSSHDEGVPSLQYCPARPEQGVLFKLTRPIEDLEEMLLTSFQGKTKTIDEIYHAHSVGRRYIKRNYRDALNSLEEKGLIETSHPNRRKNTFAKHVQATFPK
nr:three-Cys-motif partner protein TcmP [uncultured Pseudodesulfovibrio sp.]